MLKTLTVLFLFLIFLAVLCGDDRYEKVIQLWPAGKMPCSIEVDFTETDVNGIISNVSNPILYFCPAKNKKSDSTVIICPGGGYSCLVYQYEGFQVAEYFNSLGMNAFVLKYRHKPYQQPAPLADAQRAIRIVRRDSKQYGINPDKIGIMGFSAGGHLAASTSTMFDDNVYNLEDDKNISARPDYSILVYPVITMGPETDRGSRDSLLGQNPTDQLIKQYSCQNRITGNTPPTFMTFASDDDIVPVANGILYYQSLIDNNINAEFHIYNVGGHGFHIGDRDNLTVEKWKEHLKNWLICSGILEK